MWESRDTLGSLVLTSQISGNCPCAYCSILQIIVMFLSGQVAMLVPHKTRCGTLASWQVSISTLWLSLWLLLRTGVCGICCRGFSHLVTPWLSHSPPQAPVPEAVSTRAVGLKVTHSPCPLVLQMCKFISWFNHLLWQNCSLQTTATCKCLPLCLQGDLNPNQFSWVFLFKEPDKWPWRYIMWPCTSVCFVT